jgi:hypothetical protein
MPGAYQNNVRLNHFLDVIITSLYIGIMLSNYGSMKVCSLQPLDFSTFVAAKYGGRNGRDLREQS